MRERNGRKENESGKKEKEKREKGEHWTNLNYASECP